MMTTKNGRITIIQEIVKINWNIILFMSFIYADYKAKVNDFLALWIVILYWLQMYDFKYVFLIVVIDYKVGLLSSETIGNMGNSKGQRHIYDPIGNTDFSGRDCNALIRWTSVFTK